MLAYVLARHALAQAAAGGLIVLALGSLAARGCRQPVERIRIVLLTILTAVAVPCVGMLPIAPKWSVGVALATTATEGHSAADTMTTPLPRESAARVESLQPTAVSAPTNAGTRSVCGMAPERGGRYRWGTHGRVGAESHPHVGGLGADPWPNSPTAPKPI